jgi:DNA-binding transcriptional regulator YiaG
MPNIGAVLKQEITRLSRRESRAQIAATRKASTQHRRDIAALKAQVGTLTRQLAQLQKRSSLAAANGSGPASTRPRTSAEPAQKVRFVAKGLKSQRERLALSAADYGRLIGVSAQSVYNWEHGHASPQQAQVLKIAALRGVGKREAQRRLEQLAAKGNS